MSIFVKATIALLFPTLLLCKGMRLPLCSGASSTIGSAASTNMSAINTQRGGASETKPAPWRPWADTPFRANTLGKR